MAYSEEALSTPPSELTKGLGKMAMRVRIEAQPSSNSDNKWRKDEYARLSKELKVLKSELANFDEAKIIEQAKKSLKAEIATTSARLLECEARMDNDGIKYGPEA